MSLTALAWASSSGDLGANTQRSHAYRYAEALLRQDTPLRPEQFHELDELFRQTSAAELMMLTQDERHRAQLRRYEALSCGAVR